MVRNNLMESEKHDKWTPDWVAIGYSTSLISCGYLGYLKSAKPGSIFTGLIYGGIAGVGAYFSSVDQTEKGHYLNFINSTALVFTTGKKYYKTGKLIPLGLVCGLSTCMAIRSSKIIFLDSQSSDTTTDSSNDMS